MRANVRAAVAWCLVANYLLAITVATCFHTHSGPRCGASAGDCRHQGESFGGGTLTDHRCCPPSDAADSAWTHVRPSGARHEADTCPVCEFLAQRPAASQPVSQVACQWLRWEPALLPVTWHSRRISSTCRVRAPPA